jgi:hypothetical protein
LNELTVGPPAKVIDCSGGARTTSAPNVHERARNSVDTILQPVEGLSDQMAKELTSTNPYDMGIHNSGEQSYLNWKFTLTALGIATALVAATATTRLMHLPLFGITPLDPLAFALMPVPLAAAAILASYVPARRALAVDLVETMRAE